MKDSGSTINIYGDVVNSQIQQSSHEFVQSKRISDRKSDDPYGIGLEACVMLLYAAEDRGEIIVSSTLSGTNYVAGNWNLNASQSGRELARWEEAKEQLLSHRYVKPIGYKGEIFHVTALGYRIADGFKGDNQLDTTKSPIELMLEFE